MSDKYAALKQAAEWAIADEGSVWWNQEQLTHSDGPDIHRADAGFIANADPSTILELLAERDADRARIAEMTAERDALREGEMGDAKHSNTRAAADIYFQLVEECEIQAGGSLVEHIDDMCQRLANAEHQLHMAELAKQNLKASRMAQFKKRRAAEQRVAELEARTLTAKFEPIPMSELGNKSDGAKHPYMFGAGYNSAVVHCGSELQRACAAAGISLKIEGE